MMEIYALVSCTWMIMQPGAEPRWAPPCTVQQMKSAELCETIRARSPGIHLPATSDLAEHFVKRTCMKKTIADWEPIQ